MGDSKYVDPTQAYADAHGGNRDLNAGRSNSFYDFLTKAGSGGNVSEMLGRALSEYGRTSAQQVGEFNAALPGITEGAAGVADQALSMYGAPAEAYATRMSDANRRSIEDRLSTSGLGNFGSGAALGAIAGGVATPYAETARDLAGMRSQAFMNAYSPTAQATYGAQLNRGNQYANLGNALLGALAGQSEQQILAPAFQYKPGFWDTMASSTVSGLSGAAGSFLGTEGGGNWLAKIFGGGQTGTP